MFSYLRPHRRTPSNPTSPLSDQSWEDHGHTHHPRHQDGDQYGKMSSPPSLPPIPRVFRANYDGSTEAEHANTRKGIHERDSRTQSQEAVKENMRPREGHMFSNHPRMAAAGNQRPESAGNPAPSKYSTSQHAKPQTDMHASAASRGNPVDSSSRPRTASGPQSRLVTNRQPTGTRLPTPPPGSNATPTFEFAQPKSKRMNLLNPMSLLARRRTSQAVAQLSAESLVSSRNGNNSGPSYSGIRGTVVHDFSAPRPRRIVSTPNVPLEDSHGHPPRQYQRSPNNQGGEDGTTSGQWSAGHTPVFTENFEEEQYPAAGPHVRKASDVSDLPLPRPPYAKGAPRLVDLNSISKSNDSAQQENENAKRTSAKRPDSEIPPPVPPKSAGRSAPPRRISIDPKSTPPKITPSMKGERPRNVSEVSAKDVAGFALPKHMKSTSSRFSFDMIGAAEQERLLEDRHRQRALERRNGQDNGQDEDEMDDEEYGYENMDDDGVEEEIPMVGDDYDEEDPNGFEEEDVPLVGDNDYPPDNEGMLDDKVNISRFTFQQQLLSPLSPLSPNSPDMISTPRDANGDVIGFAMTKNSPYPSMDAAHNLDGSIASSVSTDIIAAGMGLGIDGLGLQYSDATFPNSPMDVNSKWSNSQDLTTPQFPGVSDLEDDGLYFDDGLIEEFEEGEPGVEFDESVFDNVDTDQYGRPLKTFSSLPTLYSPPGLRNTLPPFKEIDESDASYLTTTDVKEKDVSPAQALPSDGLAPQASVVGKRSSNAVLPTSGLTQDTLEAYQSALAAAAFNAAANGKFRRDSTPGTAASEHEDNHPGLVTDSGHDSHSEPFSPSYEDDFEYDDTLEDDAIIAAANAEALACDIDGFYGQEFGFYSAPAGEAEFVNGGYFGPRGVEGINRTRSGRLADREANLTPITERSEYSNRNSFMSPGLWQRPESIASPGLAQLAGLMSSSDYDGDMSLNSLLKLRRGAWGGSQASLHSSSPKSAGGADETSSPIGQPTPWAQGGAVTLPMGGHRRTNSAFSLVSDDPSGAVTENNSAPSSPTITMANFIMSLETGQHNEKGKEVQRHRHTTSADSISYLKEDDPGSPTGERWVLERRRTSEAGVELLGREVVSGGRI